MITYLIADYLMEKGRISKEQCDALYDELGKVRVKLGLIAVSEGMMTPKQADEVNTLQAKLDKRFGEIAVEKGYLTDGQVMEILKLQGNPYLSIAQALENLKIMKMDELENVMKEYQKEHELSASSLDAVKSDDVSRFLSVFMPSGAEHYLELAGVAFRTITRFVDINAFPRKGYFTQSVDASSYAIQLMEGENIVITALAGNGDDLLPIASLFGKEDFASVDEDALDAVAEMINCINGLYASALSQNHIEMELCPPEFSVGIKTMTSDKLLVLPIVVSGKTVKLILAINHQIDIQ